MSGYGGESDLVCSLPELFAQWCVSESLKENLEGEKMHRFVNRVSSRLGGKSVSKSSPILVVLWMAVWPMFISLLCVFSTLFPCRMAL